MLEDELYIEWVLRPRYDRMQSARARMLREALLLRASEREARPRAERAAARGHSGGPDRAQGQMLRD